MTKTRVLIADDDRALAEALADTVNAAGDLEVVAMRHDTDAVVKAAAVHRPQVILMDVKMPGGGGVEATRRVLMQQPEIAVVGLSAHEDHGTATAMLDAGAIAYVVKGMPEDEIVDAIRRASRGQMSMPADLGAAAFRQLLTKLHDTALSEASLRSSEERVHALVDAMPDALLIVSTEGKIEVVNVPAERMFGYSAAELVGESVQMLVPERFRPTHLRDLAAFLTRPRNRPMGAGKSLYARRRDGSEFPVAISLSPLRPGPGSPVVAAVRDTTMAREADDVRRKSEQLFRGLLESAPDALVVVDPTGRIRIVNTRTEQLFGYTREELVGMSVDELVPDSLRRDHGRHRAKYFADPQVRPMGQGLELLGRRRDDSEFPVDISLSPMATDEGTFVIAAVRDITDRKVAEKRLADSHEIAERRKLVARLVQAQEEERRKIAADIHDDSIQAMTAASLRLQQLRKHMTTPQQQELVGRLDEAVRESITRLRRLMFDLRPPTLDRTGLGPAIREALERLHLESDIEFSLDDRLVSEPASDVQIEMYRIAQEALTNIRKHSNAGHVTVALQCVDNGVRMRIHDDGVGFDVTLRSNQPGHLGLIAMRERATIAGGRWTIESRPGTGTTVDLWLPDDDAAAAGAAAGAAVSDERLPGSPAARR